MCPFLSFLEFLLVFSPRLRLPWLPWLQMKMETTLGIRVLRLGLLLLVQLPGNESQDDIALAGLEGTATGVS